MTIGNRVLSLLAFRYPGKIDHDQEFIILNDGPLAEIGRLILEIRPAP